MAKPVNYRKQIWAVERLMLPPSYGDYHITKFECDEITGTHSVMVKREYKAPDWKTTCYHDCYIIGPRGGSKTVYNTLF